MPQNSSFWYQSDHKVLVHLIHIPVLPVSVSICQKRAFLSEKRIPENREIRENARSGASRKFRAFTKCKTPKTLNSGPLEKQKQKQPYLLNLWTDFQNSKCISFLIIISTKSSELWFSFIQCIFFSAYCAYRAYHKWQRQSCKDKQIYCAYCDYRTFVLVLLAC